MSVVTKEELRNSIKASSHMTDANADALNQEGFPDYMIWSFLQTAEQENTIVSSRLPGGAGLDLIEAGYDLKGFQIKAKSCDWGPMAGFICQLPFLNKAGYKNIVYNTKYIIDYLNALNRFSPSKEKTDIIEAALQEMRDILSDVKISQTDRLYTGLLSKISSILTVTDSHIKKGILTSDDQKKILQLVDYADYRTWNNARFERIKLGQIMGKVYEVYYPKIGAITTSYRTIEQKSAEWSGENSLVATDKSPFIALNREFSSVTATAAKAISLMKGVVRAEPSTTDDKVIVGMAVNNEIEDDSTIKIDFVLEKVAGYVPRNDGMILWAMYYEKIYYREISNKLYFPSSPVYTTGLTAAEQSTLDIKAKIRSKKDNESIENYVEYKAATEREFVNGIQKIYNRTDDEKKIIGDRTCYPIYGIMNPHPPFGATVGEAKAINPEFYKNAVSGDFDLFAFWPYNTIPSTDLVRLSENHLDEILSYSIHADFLFCLEFIPGFSELTDKNKENLRESAEEGNIHNLGRSAAGWLNCFATQAYARRHTNNEDDNANDKDKKDKKLAVNKAFHSDEGGRPGIMEIEFPIAIFFPENPPQTFINARAGLIKNPSELVRLILHCNSSDTKYRIMMHSEWMIHLFYISLSKNERTDFLAENDSFLHGQQPPQRFFTELRSRDSKGESISENSSSPVATNRRESITKYMKDNFSKLEDHHVEMYDENDASFIASDFLKDFKMLLRVSDSTFVKLQLKFLELAFQSDRSAGKRLADIRTIFSAT